MNTKTTHMIDYLPGAGLTAVGDLNCPFCYALNEWIDEQGYGSTVSYFGIEHLLEQSPTRLYPIMACFRQVYRVTSEMPSCRDNSITDMLCGGNNFFRTATLRSGE